MNKNAILSATYALAVILAAGSATAGELGDKNEFRGIDCGAPLPEDMTKLADPMDNWWRWANADRGWARGATEYQRKGDRLSVGEATLDAVSYYFFEGKFLGATLMPSKVQPAGSNDFRDTLITAFGECGIIQTTESSNECVWKGEHMVMRSPGIHPIKAYSVSFICEDVLTAKTLTAQRLAEEARKGQSNKARPKDGDF